MINDGKPINPLLLKVENAIKSHVKPQFQGAFEKVIKLGENIMYSPDTHKMMMQEVNLPGDPLENAGQGIAKLIGILYKKSNGSMPMQAAVPGGQILLCEALDYMEKLGKVQVTNDTIATATQALAASILQLVGVTQDKLHSMYAQAVQKASGGQQPPPQGAPGQPPQGAPQGIIAGAMGAQ